MFNAFLILKDGQLLTWMLWISKVVFIIKKKLTNILIGLRVSKWTANLNFKVNHLFNNPKSYLDGWIGLWMIDLHSLSTHRWHDISTVEISHCFSLLCTGELQKGLTQSTKKKKQPSGYLRIIHSTQTILVYNWQNDENILSGQIKQIVNA